MIRTARQARSRVAATLVAAALVAVLAACSGGGDAGPTQTSVSPPPSPSPSAVALVGVGCPDAVEGGTQVRFGDDDYLAGVVMGSGTTAVVLAHEYESDACNWLPYAKTLAKKGYTTLAFDFAGYGASGLANGTQSTVADVEAAAAYLRAHGAKKIVLMGASMGGNAVLAATKDVHPAAVVSLSAPRSFQGVVVDGADVTAPVLYVAGKYDSGGSFADDARSMAAQTPKGKKTLDVLPDAGDHGTALLRSPAAEKVEHDIATLLGKYAPAAS
jgi:pimeloyl-ACP methyl ester carboxylesterase